MSDSNAWYYRVTGVKCETMPLAIVENQGTINEKTPRFPGDTKEKAGFRFRVIEGARTPDLRNHNPPDTNENTGFDDTPQHFQQQSKSTDSKNTAISDDNETLLAVARESLRASRMAVEKLIGSIPLDDQFALEILGPILSGLRDAARRIGDLS